jgi:hypothetical protein
LFALFWANPVREFISLQWEKSVKEGLMKKVFQKIWAKIISEVFETIEYASQKEEIELALRGVIGGSILAFFLSNESAYTIAFAFVVSLWIKKKNSERR